MVLKFVELRLRFVAVIGGTALVFGYWDELSARVEAWRHGGAGESGLARDVEYFCPMHPAVVTAEPSKCPLCAMPLSKRKVGERMELPPGVLARVEMSPERVAQAGMRVETVSYRPLADSFATVGTVEIDERRLARISSRVRGMTRIESLSVNFTGDAARRGEPLAELYNPELYQAIRELRQTGSGGVGGLFGDSEGDAPRRLAEEKLRLWGFDAEQIERLRNPKTPMDRVPLYSPIDGVVIRKNVVEGQYVAEGEPLFEVADLSRVWIKARVYEDRLATVRVGAPIEATTRAYPGETFPGKVAFVDPTLDPATRTVGARFDLRNPGGKLRPGMYASVTIRAPLAEGGAGSASASASGSGSGSASGIEPVSLTVEEQRICPVTNEPLGSMGDPLLAKAGGASIWVCCEGCVGFIEDDPEKYFAKLPALREKREAALAEAALKVSFETAEAQKVCPVTNLELGSMGPPLPVALETGRVWICCAGCEDRLRGDPRRYLARFAPAPAGTVLSVPESAVIDTGARRVVYVESEPGIFDAREVRLGPRAGTHYPVLEGLAPGDRVAASGAFLIDAETRLNPATSATYVGSTKGISGN